MIIALLNQKGGVGKTTLATHIAGELSMQGSAVILIDADPQGSALDVPVACQNQDPMRVDMATGAKCRTHSHAPAYFPLRGVKGSLRRAAPALDSASGAGTVGRRRPIRN